MVPASVEYSHLPTPLNARGWLQKAFYWPRHAAPPLNNNCLPILAVRWGTLGVSVTLAYPSGEPNPAPTIAWAAVLVAVYLYRTLRPVQARSTTGLLRGIFPEAVITTAPLRGIIISVVTVTAAPRRHRNATASGSVMARFVTIAMGRSAGLA